MAEVFKDLFGLETDTAASSLFVDANPFKRSNVAADKPSEDAGGRPSWRNVSKAIAKARHVDEDVVKDNKAGAGKKRDTKRKDVDDVASPGEDRLPNEARKEKPAAAKSGGIEEGKKRKKGENASKSKNADKVTAAAPGAAAENEASDGEVETEDGAAVEGKPKKKKIKEKEKSKKKEKKDQPGRLGKEEDAAVADGLNGGTVDAPALRAGVADDTDEEEASAGPDKVLSKEEQNLLKLERTIFVGNVPASTHKKALVRHFSTHGAVESVRFRSVPVAAEGKEPRRAKVITGDLSETRSSKAAFVVFADNAGAKAALMENMALEEDVYNFFDGCGSAILKGAIEAIRVVRDRKTNMGKGIAYVLFKDKNAVTEALQMSKQTLKSREIRISRPKRSATSVAAAPALATSGMTGAERRLAGKPGGPAAFEGIHSSKAAVSGGKAQGKLKHSAVARVGDLAGGTRSSKAVDAAMMKGLIRKGKRPSVAARKLATLKAKGGDRFQAYLGVAAGRVQKREAMRDRGGHAPGRGRGGGGEKGRGEGPEGTWREEGCGGRPGRSCGAGRSQQQGGWQGGAKGKGWVWGKRREGKRERVDA
eukprot:jgi/Mesvir1/24020/Mv10762-RA.1